MYVLIFGWQKEISEGKTEGKTVGARLSDFYLCFMEEDDPSMQWIFVIS